MSVFVSGTIHTCSISFCCIVKDIGIGGQDTNKKCCIICAVTGIPIVRKMEFVFPHQGFEACNDQFMLGDSILVAPVITKGEKRPVNFPRGKWMDATGSVFTGPLKKEMVAPLERLLWFRRLKNEQ
jgi:alpha-glucosidase (family GH31 glycosyl hydrolase)